MDGGRGGSCATPLDELFDVVVESSKDGRAQARPGRLRAGARRGSASPPSEVVFLDDLGINLKPARAMGMTTIKVDGAGRRRWHELEACLGLSLR